MPDAKRHAAFSIRDLNPGNPPSIRAAPGASGIIPIEAEACLTAIAASSEDAIITLTLDGVIATWNDAAERILGHRAAEIVGCPVAVIVPPERLHEAANLLDQVRLGQRVHQSEAVKLRKDGSRVDVAVTAAPIHNASGRAIGVVMLVRDRSEEKRTRETAARLQLAIEAAPNGMVMIDQRGVILMVNAQMVRLFGYERAEMLGQPVEMLLPGRYRHAHPQQREDFFHSPATRAMGHGRDLFARRKDGSEFPVEVGLNPAETPEGRFVLAAVIDITQRKHMEAELAQAHTELRDRARKLEATVAERTSHLEQTIAELEGVSYSLSHDMRAPLRTIHGFAQIVLAESSGMLPPEQQQLLQRIIIAADRLDRLIKDVLMYTRVSRQPLPLGVVEVEDIVRQIIEERLEFQPPNADIEITFPLEPVRGHEVSVTQCISNLLENAVKFVAPGQRPRVRIWTEVAGERVRLWVEDNGIGIPKEARPRLFGIFERFHDRKQYPGTGIGLAIVRKAVERMGGTITVESEPGQGSRFCLVLQRAGASPS
jgi:PAS domain S-box-containing protein